MSKKIKEGGGNKYNGEHMKQFYIKSKKQKKMQLELLM